MDVVAYSNGDAVIVNMPSVKKLGQGETSFTTESSSATNEDEEAENNTNDPVPTGPLSGFLQRRAQRIAARASLREERQRKEEARTKAREEEQRRAEEEQAKIKEAIPERLIEPDLESTRAGTISATVVKTESNSYGLGLEQIKEDVVRFKALVGKGLLRDCPLRVGDIVKTVNDEAVTEYRSVMLKLMKMNGPVTITVENPSPQSNPAVVQAFCRKPNRDARFGIQLDVVEHSTTQNELCGDLNGTQEVAMSKLLQIKAINAKGLMGQSALSPGDFILAINGTACAEMSVEEAASLVAESEFTLDILALNPELAQKHCSPTRLQRWLRSARRTGVGAVGGTMRELQSLRFDGYYCACACACACASFVPQNKQEENNTSSQQSLKPYLCVSFRFVFVIDSWPRVDYDSSSLSATLWRSIGGRWCLGLGNGIRSTEASHAQRSKCVAKCGRRRRQGRG